jgi:urocanate hydratase
MATNGHKTTNGRFTVSSTGGKTTVRESKSGRIVLLKGYGAMQGKFPLATGIDLTKPIAAQVKLAKAPKAKSGDASKRH